MIVYFPPVIVIIIFTILMGLVSLITPNISIPGWLNAVITISIVLMGLFFLGAGVISFKQAQTTVDPTQPDKASTLVTSSIYKITRNPMYVGFLLVLVGWGIFLSNLFSLALLIAFVLYMNRFQIGPEERALEAIFGNDFVTYKKQVRRWL